MIGLIDYGMGNLLSVYKAVKAVGGDVEIVTKPDEIQRCTAIILPGVGSFGDGMENLNSTNLVSAIKQGINEGKPFLGICLGLQMLMESSEESPGIKGLGIFKGKVLKFPEETKSDKGDILKVPHIGWNNIRIKSPHACLKNIPSDSYFYFVHSYYVNPDNPEFIAADCEYIKTFPAALAYKNIFATQFHPEKSQNKGLQILKNFIGIQNCGNPVLKNQNFSC